MNLPLHIYAGNLPLNNEGTQIQLFQAIRNRLRGYADASALLTGDIVDILAPASNLGPWFDKRKWYMWDGFQSAYAPEVRKFDGPNVDIAQTLTATPTKNRQVYLPDKSGTMLMVNDIYVPRATIIVTASPYTIDWTRSNDFLCRLQSNVTFYMAGSKEGQRISVFVQNNGTNYRVTWPGYVYWPTGIQPVMPASQAGQNHMSEYKFININGIIYGEHTSLVTHANPANTVFTGGSGTDSGKEVSIGIHPGGASIYPTRLPN